MPPKLSPSLLGGIFEDDDTKAAQMTESERLYSLYPSMRPKPELAVQSDNQNLPPMDRALHALYPTISPKPGPEVPLAQHGIVPKSPPSNNPQDFFERREEDISPIERALRSLYPSMTQPKPEPKAPRNDQDLSPIEQALYALYPSMRPKPEPEGISEAPTQPPEEQTPSFHFPATGFKVPSANQTLPISVGSIAGAGLTASAFAPIIARAALTPAAAGSLALLAPEIVIPALIAGGIVVAGKYGFDAAKEYWNKPSEAPPSELIIPDAPQNNKPTPEQFPQEKPQPPLPPSEPSSPLKQLPPSTRPEVNKDDGILADPIDDQANQATVLEISKLSKPIPIIPGEPLPENIEKGLENIKDPEQRAYIKGLISGGYQISGDAKDGCNIDAKGDYESFQAQLSGMKEQFGGEISYKEMPKQPGKQFPVLTLPGEPQIKIAARPTAKSTGTPTLEISIMGEQDKAYTIKIRAN